MLFTFGVFLITILGLCVGSFLNVVIYRLPRGQTVVTGRSFCPHCGNILSWCDLVPVLSYLILRGRCRYCGAKISWRYPLVEVVTAAIFFLVFLYFGDDLFLLLKYFFLSGLLIAAAFIDVEHYLIPDKLVLAGLVAGIIFTLLPGDLGVGVALLGAVVAGGFLFLVAVLSRGGLGGGDIKLGAVVGLFLGWPLGPLSIFLGCCLGGFAGLILLMLRIKGRKDPLPLGPFIALGSFVSLFWGQQVIDWYFRCLWL
ncbi:MAG: Type 4 prepilin-like proteins leader peptide-processing enzyme PilD [Thermoanaerobacterales bacterium 50_218]|nr:MAG: Type 4 prepilin-like proteins leader peptide-processing enzyme PilD [Thermoanaerobacterales bacterium 50_218]HAA89361.1 prepilin peptidase [Peptococcaceae bacterium]